MTATYSAGPLRVCGIDGTDIAFAGNVGGFGVRRCPRPAANARRLAACWNALEGVPTDAIEAFTACMTEQRQFATQVGSVGSLYDERNGELAAARALLAEVIAPPIPSIVGPHRQCAERNARIAAFLAGGA